MSLAIMTASQMLRQMLFLFSPLIVIGIIIPIIEFRNDIKDRMYLGIGICLAVGLLIGSIYLSYWTWTSSYNLGAYCGNCTMG